MKISNTIIFTMLAGLLLTNCKPKESEDKDLPAPAQADFTMTKYEDPNDPAEQNTYIFRNTTPGSFIYSWDFGGEETSLKNVDTVFFAYAKTYKIKLTASSAGGSSTVVKDLVIPATSPYAADFTVTKLDDHNFQVAVTTPSPVDQTFKFANGDSAKTTTATVYYPFQGDFDISLRVVTAKGPSTLTKTVNVATEDLSNPARADQTFIKLTGGPSDLDGKTWIMSTAPGITGVGPYKANEIDVSYWAYPAAEGGYGGAFTEGGMADNEFTFIFNKYQYVPLNQKVTVHYNWAVSDFGKPYVLHNDLALNDPNHIAQPFILKNTGVGITGYTLGFGGKTYMGYMDGRRQYEIAKITNDSLWVRHKYSDLVADNPANDVNQRVFLFTVKP